MRCILIQHIENLRLFSRKLVRELGVLQLEHNDGSTTTPIHYHALIEIKSDPGMTISKLAETLVISPSKATRLVQSLIKAELVSLRRGVDRREKFLHVTKLGEEEIHRIHAFSETKIKGAFEFLDEADVLRIIESIATYANALEKNRLTKEQVKIATLPTSRTIRKQIVNMILHIQKNEFSIPVTDEINACVLKAEQDFYYHNTYNFWYATDLNGYIVGSIGLKKINDTCGEVKKFFVTPEYRGKKVAQKLMRTLLNAATKHGFQTLYLGTVNKLKIAQKFYLSCGFERIDACDLPENFDMCPLDTAFFSADINVLIRYLQ